MTDRLKIEPKAPASRIRAPRAWFAPVRLLAGLAAVLAMAVNLPAQSAGTPVSALAAQNVSSNRFLFVVDTSAGMKRHLEDVVKVAQDIIRSGASGQLHNGDTIGVWTFNETIYSGNLPLQQWLGDDSEEIALRMTEFFRQQPFAKQSRLDLAMLGIAEIVKHSDILTVFIISDGSGRMQGTPFDQQINASYQQSLQDMKKDRRPLVTVLQSKGGRFIRYTVNAVPWPVVIPEVPIPIRLANVPPARPAPTTTGTVPTNTPVTPESKPTPSMAAIPPQTVVNPPPAARVPNQPVTERQAAVPTPTVLPPQLPPVTAPTAMTPTPVASHPNPAETVTASTPRATPQVLPRPAAATNQTLAVNKIPPAPSPKPAQIAGSNPKPATSDKIVPPATVRTNAAPAPAQPKASLIAQGTALVKSFAGDHPRILLIGGGVMIVIALGLIAMLVRRSRRATRISLISQSLNDEQQ